MQPYKHKQVPFVLKGICLTRAIDFLPDGKVPIAKNVRSYIEGVVQPRAGIASVYAGTVGAVVHSIERLNDEVPSASQAYCLIIGAGTNLYSDDAGHTAFTSRASGFSGNPISIIPYRPNNSPEPYAYIAETNKTGKLKVDGTFRNMGISCPTNAPKGPSSNVPTLNSFQRTDIEVGSNVASYVISAGFNSKATTTGTDSFNILYDTGTTGWANLIHGGAVAVDQPGLILSMQTNPELVLVDSIYTPIKTTTVASITYDAGATGLCTVVLNTHKRKALVPNTIINIGGENIRVISVTWGDDDLPSLRCSTTGTHTAGEVVVGAYSYRGFFVNTHANGESHDTRLVFLSGALIAANTSVIATATRVAALDLSSINGRPVQDEDEISAVVFILDNQLKNGTGQLIQEVQLQLDIGDGSFTTDYYFIAIKPSALSTTIGGQQTLQAARTNKLTDDAINAAALPSDQSVAQIRDKLQRRLAKAQQNGNTNRAIKLQRKLDDLVSNPIDIPPNPPVESSPNTSRGSIPTVSINGYTTFRIKVKDLQRVGNAPDLGLANVNSIRIRILATNSTSIATANGDFQFLLGSFWVGGAYGPDAGTAGIPYLYRFRYRASESGARSFTSPATRSGVIARRQRVLLSATASADAQVDKIDWFRFGGSIQKWKYIGTGPNSTATFNDDFPDDTIANNEELSFEDFQPFPIVSTPINATGNASGTAISITSGSVSTSMCAGTEVIINGIRCTLYAKPSSTTRFEVNENVGSLTGVSIFIPEPLLDGQPLPVMWGPYGQGFLGNVMFACGSSLNPGTLYWTNPDDPDTASDRNQLEVSSPSEPLMNGFLFNNTTYVFSSEDLYVIYPTSDATGRLTFRSNKTGLSLGLAGKYAFCIGEGRIWFVARDGIYYTESSTPNSITDEDLYPLFPHDGIAGVSVNGYSPPDFNSPNTLRLSVGDSILRFDYKATDNNYYTLIYDINNKSWLFDSYTPQLNCSYYEQGKNTHRWLLGGNDGRLYNFSGTSETIVCQLRLKSDDFGDSRLEKILAEHYLDFDPDGASITVQPGFDNYSVTPTSTILTTTAGRRQQVIDISSGAGTLVRNVTNDITFAITSQIPKLYLFDYYYLLKVENTFRRFTDYTDLGYSGPKLIRGFRLRADTANTNKVVRIEYDGTAIGVDVTVNHNGELWKSYDIPVPFMANLVRVAPQDAILWRQYDIEFIYDKYPDLDNIISQWTDGGYDGAKWLQGLVLRADSNNAIVSVAVRSDDGNTIATLSCQHNGDSTIAYSWTPYITHLMRLIPAGDIRFIDAKWVYNVEPELALTWWTQQTTHGLVGYQHIKSGYITHLSTADLSLTLIIDGIAQTPITIANSSGLRLKTYFIVPVLKGKTFAYKLTSASAFRLYKNDCEVRVKSWGSHGEYIKVNPFGDLHFDKGAAI
jgi:hypothetical protein